MEDNNLFNLMHQLTQEQKSLWRIKGAYMRDSVGSDIEEFWKELASSKEQQIETLKELIKKNM